MSTLTEFVAKPEAADETERLYTAEDLAYLVGPDGVQPLPDHVQMMPTAN